MSLILALLLDAAMGEPRWLWDRVPHPVVVMGRIIHALEQRMNIGNARKVGGVMTLAILCLGALILGVILAQLGWLVSGVIAAILISHRSLVDHVAGVAAGLRMSLPEGRRAVARIVGRDTAQMDSAEVARAAIESAAENLSDGVIAPAFWFAIGGLPGLLIYKITNTADSMIGYKTPRYREFGWAAARFDDLLNWVPARLSAGLIALSYGLTGRWSDIAADARRHRSPNAGWPEAAMARALDIALAGPRSYDGARRDYPFVNAPGRRHIGPAEIDAACSALWRVWAVGLGAVVILTLVLGPVLD